MLSPESIQCPTSTSEHPRLYLNTFRGVPAIPGFDWHITSIHNSSESFATLTSSVLHLDFIEVSTWPWIAHPASGLIRATWGYPRRPIRTRFRYGSTTKVA